MNSKDEIILCLYCGSLAFINHQLTKSKYMALKIERIRVIIIHEKPRISPHTQRKA
jgi:hypothetical protein